VQHEVVHIVAALFTEQFDMRQVPGPSTRLDLKGVFFSMASPQPAPVTIEPHLIVLVHEPAGGSGTAALETVYRRDGEQIARNVQPVQVEPGKFGYRLVRAELEFDDYGSVVAEVRLDQGAPMAVPLTLLPPAS
jgi:hypothetical protein